MLKSYKNHVGIDCMKNIANSKVQYAIRMLIWHSNLAKRYMEYIKKWLDRHHLSYDEDLIQFLSENKEKEEFEKNQTTIFDFIGEENR